MKLPKGHILKTTVRYNINVKSIEDFVEGIIKDVDNFTGYIRLLGEKGEYEEELRIIISQGEIIGAVREQIGSDKVLYGNDCSFDGPIQFSRSGASVVRLTLDDIEMIKVSYPQSIIDKDNPKEPIEKKDNREKLLKKYRIKQMSDSEITNLLKRLNGD